MLAIPLLLLGGLWFTMISRYGNDNGMRWPRKGQCMREWRS